MDIRFTKKTLLEYVNNSCCTNWYYIAYARVYVDEHRYFRIKFVVWFDINDLYDYWLAPDEDIRAITNAEINEYVGECIYGVIGMLQGYKKLQDIVDYCNETIHNYNRLGGY